VTTSSTETAAEQAYVDVLYARLDQLRDRAERQLREVRAAGAVGTPQARSERDAFSSLYENRVAQLRAVEDRLCFGRVDLRDGSRRYIGRIGLSDEARSQLLVDWRAPAARSFYQATAASPEDLVRRRHLSTRRRTVTGVEDEVLDLDELDADSASTLTGEGRCWPR
jgi:DNA helicase IV